MILWHILEQRAQAEIAAKASVLLHTVIAARSYVSNYFERQAADFAAQAVPDFAAKEIFEDFRKQEGYEGFLYKEAALNPTNVRDTADSFETELINRFRRAAGHRNSPASAPAALTDLLAKAVTTYGPLEVRWEPEA